MSDVIQGLWVGPALSTLERLSIASFLSRGHEYHLYTYGPVSGVPPGAVVRDGREILPESAIFQYPHRPSYAAFSNFFRYRLLDRRGGWWVDTDVVCLRPFDFSDDKVIATEPAPAGPTPTSGVLKLPPGSALAREAWLICCGKDVRSLRWGEVGPALVGELVERLGLAGCLVPPEVFCPIDYRNFRGVLDPDRVWAFPEATRAVHLWNERWRQEGVDKDGRHPPTCLYESLKRELLPDDR